MGERNVVELRKASIYQIKGIAKKLGNGRRVRRLLSRSELIVGDVDLAVSGGEFIYLVGKVGAGKSTLLRTLYGEVPLVEGEGKVVGYDLRKLRRKDIPHLRRRMGVVFQDYRLLMDRNVFDNLHYAMRATGWRDEAAIRRKIEQVLQVVDLMHKIYKMPHELSGGQQQRLAVARALINDPEVLLADEPTGNLDPTAAAEVMGLFLKIVESGCSVIMSTHNVAILEEYPARTLRFSSGQVEEIAL